VFFRAKEWDDAVKVLSGMIDTNGIKIIKFFNEKTIILKNIYLTTHDNSINYLINHFRDIEFAFIYILMSFILILSFKNSSQIIKQFSSNILILFFNICIFVFSIYIISLGSYSEFLYFNF
jgi:hypothetical protein